MEFFFLIKVEYFSRLMLMETFSLGLYLLEGVFVHDFGLEA